MNKLIFFGCIALVTMAMVGGFMVAGGPGFARLENDDRERAQHIEQWGRYYACQVNPDVLGGESLGSGCANREVPSKLVDPETGEAYRYTRIDPNSFQICATFRTEIIRTEKPRFVDVLTFSEDEGCAIYKRNDASARWVRQ